MTSIQTSLQSLKKMLASRSSEGDLLRATSSMLLIQPFGLALSFLLSVVLARVMGSDSFGIYFFVLSFLQIFTMLAEMGFKSSLLRFIPTYLEAQDWPKLKGILKRSSSALLTSSFTIILVTYSVVLLRQADLTNELKLSFFIAMLSLPILTHISIRTAALRSFNRTSQAAMLESLIKPLLFIAFVTIGFFSIQPLNAPLVLLLSFLASALSLGLGEFWLRRALPKAIKHVKASFETKLWLKVSLPLFAVTALLYFMKRIDAVMLGTMVNTTEVAFYGAASRISDLAKLGLTAVNMSAAPVIARLFHSNKRVELQRTLRISAKAIFVVTMLASLVLGFAGPWLLGIFGADFKTAYSALLILMVGQALSALSGPVGALMTLTGHHNEASIMVSVVLILNVSLNFLLIPRYGMNGAAIATSVSYIAYNLSALIYVMKRLKLNPSLLG